MSVAKAIKRQIFALKEGAIFVTREFLHLGNRGAVDQALYRLVCNGTIIRLAWGIFMRACEKLKLPSIPAVAAAKARAFDKRVFEHGKNIAKELNLIHSVDHVHVFTTDGSARSNFKLIQHEAVVRLVPSAPRRRHGKDTRLGKAIRCLWHLGAKRCTPRHILQLTMSLNSEERKLLRAAAYQLPTWLVNLIEQRE